MHRHRDGYANPDPQGLFALREKYQAVIELKKKAASTTEKVFSIQDLQDMLSLCDKLNKANVELENMLVNERSPESERDVKPPLG